MEVCGRINDFHIQKNLHSHLKNDKIANVRKSFETFSILQTHTLDI